VGELAKGGFRPKRTLIYAAWDGEEEGLLGSSEWVEAHMEELAAKAVAYINSDSNSRGLLDLGGSHSLETFVNQSLEGVQDPAKKTGVLARLRSRSVLEGSPDERKKARAREQVALEPLGSGSDFTPFLQHAAVASLNIGYGGEGDYGQYHSIYDSFAHYTRFMDPDFSYGVALARTGGRLALRLAQADSLPLDFGPLATAIEGYLGELRGLADLMREETQARNSDLDAGVFTAYFTPYETRVAPPRQEPVPHLNLAPLENGVERMKQAVAAFHAARVARAGRPLAAENARALDGVLLGCERALSREAGLPGRPWYRHQIYAPGRYTGYGVKTLPGVREAIELRNWREAEEQAVLVGQTLEGFAAQVDRATGILKQP
jgi:N-acetylated-alpha-linked acidic dipeptidase